MIRWKKWLPLLVVGGLLLCWVSAALNKQVLIQNNRQPLIADEIWEGPDKIFFVKGAHKGTVPSVSGQKIIHGSFSNPNCYLPLLAAHFKDTLKTAAAQLSPGSQLRTGLRNLIGQALAYKVWIAVSISALVLFLILAGFRRRHGIRKNGSWADPTAKPEALNPRLIGISDVETLFLELFREKLGAHPGASSAVELLDNGGRPSAKRRVELKVKHDDTWHRRRMSIAPIGENTGSKSQCFYVIYDSHMVVKISPTPITDLEIYLSKVQAEAKIMRQLAPKECVIPNLSVVLKKVYALPGADRMSADNIEEEYARLLRLSPAHQGFFKVGGNFAFFMDLAKYYFLSHVTDGFHDTGKAIEKELSADTEILNDSNQFESKYGRQGTAVWPDLYRAYKQFQQELSSARATSSETIDISQWQIKIWFLSRMAGVEIQDPSIKISENFSAVLNDRLSKLGDAQIAVGERYRQILNQYIRSRNFNRNRPLMGAMVTNLLELLTWLDDKKVSMRDLKPDNLLVAGTPSEYPQFLKSARNYSIGLIDLETAVDCKGKTHLQMRQPQLGGTPYYATPSHFFNNVLLQEIHQDLSQVLHLQDWYAILVIIYQVVTGRKLFVTTARKIPLLMKLKLKVFREKGDLKETYINFSQVFWDTARAEFKKNSQAAAVRLNSVTAVLPTGIKERLSDHIQQQLSEIDSRMAACLDSNTAFNTGKNRLLLEKSSVENLKDFRIRYARRANSDTLVCRIDDLIEFKRLSQNLRGWAQMLQPPSPEVTVSALMEMMFDLVETQLRPKLENATEKPVDSGKPPSADDDDERPEKTDGLGYTHTIAEEE